MTQEPDAIVVGAGIVGAATAMVLAREGHRVLVLDAAGPSTGTTAAGMGHVVVMDDSDAQGALTRWSQSLWDDLAPALPLAVEHDPCGTLWVAADDEELAAVESKAAWCAERGVPCEVLDGDALKAAEPHLRRDLVGALRLPGDSVVYPPTATAWMLEQAQRAGAVMSFGPAGAVSGIDADGTVRRARRAGSGDALRAPIVVCAAGERSLDLLEAPPEGAELKPRKGHLAITARYPGLLRHQVVELGYLKSAHGHDDVSVAFNVQPRTTGQVLIGSSRQYDRPDDSVEHDVLARMLRRAVAFMPALGDCDIVRSWTGFRPATPDNLPLVGRISDGVFIAAGHEGLGITTSLGTAHLIADAVAGRPSAIDAAPFTPSRFAGTPHG